jgi:hypothetical protein
VAPSSALDVDGTVDATDVTEAGSDTLSNDITGDADTVDGQDGSAFLELDGTDSMNGTLDMGGQTVALRDGRISNDGDAEGIGIDDTGQVGIGTADPSSQLDVSGDVGVDGNVNMRDDDVTNVSQVDFGEGMSVKQQDGNVVITDS